MDNKETKFLKTLSFSIVWIIGFTILYVIITNSLFGSGIERIGNEAYRLYSKIENWFYTLPLIVGLIFIVKKFYFPKVILIKSVDKQIDKNLSNADELKKYSDLKDQGIITEEEFQAKKKKLLDL